MGQVTIINQSIIDAGTAVNASVESNDTYGMQRKTMMGVNADYEFNKNLTIGASLMFLNEQPLTTKVNMGSEPLKNTLWGTHISWKRESQWLTNMLAKLPLVHCTQPSYISFNGEFAQLIAGQNKRIQGAASYLDDFESSSRKSSLTTPTYWTLASTPSVMTEGKLSNDVRYGFNRALLSWYYVDPIFTRRSSTLTPAHIKSDPDAVSNHYVREVYERELYPQKAQNSYSSATALQVLNLAYYPNERGPYNLNPELNQEGHLLHPETKWVGVAVLQTVPDAVDAVGPEAVNELVLPLVTTLCYRLVLLVDEDSLDAGRAELDTEHSLTSDDSFFCSHIRPPPCSPFRGRVECFVGRVFY